MKRCFHAGISAAKKSGSQLRWLDRQSGDSYTRQARADDYRSRAAFKLIEIDRRYKLFRPGQTVVDLGFAPGSWSQVAVKRTRPHGRVIGVDMLQVQPPPGVIAVQGNFLSTAVQEEVRKLVRNHKIGTRANPALARHAISNSVKDLEREVEMVDISENRGLQGKRGVADATECEWTNSARSRVQHGKFSILQRLESSLTQDLCDAALIFSMGCLKVGGSFVCKFYTGSEDQRLESRLQRAFKYVNRVKPEATRSESREAYFVAQKKRSVTAEEIFPGLVPGND